MPTRTATTALPTTAFVTLLLIAFGQALAPVQVAGGLVVVATVMWLGLRRA